MNESDVKLIARATVDSYEEKVGEPRHAQNTKKIDRLSWITAVGLGIVLTLQVLLSAGAIHVSTR